MQQTSSCEFEELMKNSALSRLTPVTSINWLINPSLSAILIN